MKKSTLHITRKSHLLLILPSLQAEMEQYWPSELISEKARNTTGLVWPLQVSGVCLRLLMVWPEVTRGHWRLRDDTGAWETPGPGQRCSTGPLDRLDWLDTLQALSSLHTFKTGITTLSQ